VKHIYIIILGLGLAFASGCNEPNNVESSKKKQDTLSQTNINSVPPPRNEQYAGTDISPMDMEYFPPKYPKLKMTGGLSTPPLARLIYSRPHLGGRNLFPDVLAHDVPWRMGANEATEIEFFANVTIQQKQITKGRYVLYCIPHQASWTLVLNSNTDSWGLLPNRDKDVAQFEIKIDTAHTKTEYFSMEFKGENKKAELVMQWDSIEATLPMEF